MVQPVMFNVIVKQLCNNLKRLIFDIFPCNSKHTSIVDHFICYSLPLSFQPLLVVGHLDTAIGHLPNAQDLEHQDSKRPNVAPEYQYLLPDLFFIEERISLFNKSHMLVNSLWKRASGAVHFIGNFSLVTLILGLGGKARPKSAT